MIFLLLLAFAVPLWADQQVLEPPLRVDMPPPEGSESTFRNVFQSFTPMPIDHFDPQNHDTYLMRYMTNEDFFGGDGYPIFIMVGGEWDILPGWLRAGNMYQMAVENRGYLIYTEHRYYGQSLPYQNFTSENLRFLNVDQALADLAYFIEDVIRTQPRFADSRIILYGGSYAANMVLWFKQRYPHLVAGVVASSGPILAKVNFHEYLEVVNEAFLLEGGEQCLATIRQGIQDTVTAMETEEGRRLLETNYRLCQPLNYDDIYDMGYFSGLITWSFSGAVQQARPGTLLTICNNFNNNAYGSTPMQQVSGFVAAQQGLGPNNCWIITYDGLKNTYSQNTNSRAWYFQTCTEYGFFQIAPTSGTAFDPLWWLTVDFYADICQEVFDRRFDEQFIYNAAERVNRVFGGLQPNVNDTINVHGYIDPWRALGVYDQDLKEGSPTHTVPRASHCFDMQGWLQTDTIRMTNVQQSIRRQVARWLL